MSGLPWNGESFPIRLSQGFEPIPLDRISLQGTSALDTILDARNPELPGFFSHIIEVESMPSGSTLFSHDKAFIDGFTIRGARANGQLPRNPTGAGIYIRGVPGIQGYHVTITISNCVITNNDIGIAVDSSYFVDPIAGPKWQHHAPRIVNNTIAWNGIGLWAGDLNPQPSFTNLHALVIINNIFDPGSPPNPIPGMPGTPQPGISCFEGVDQTDLEVVSRDGNTVPNLDFNAWDPLMSNHIVASPWVNWPAPQVPLGTMLPSPRVNIRPYSSARAVGGASLYINDIFRQSPVGAISTHDFSLSPHVSPNSLPPASQNPLIPNPMVNRGIECMGGTGTIVLAHGRSIPCSGPGLPVAWEEAPIISWDFDTEGFGNPRVVPMGPPFYSDFTYGRIDLGADELDRLAMRGFVTSTRMFTNVPGAEKRFQVYFFNLVNTTGLVRPVTNNPTGKSHQWFPHLRTPIDTWTGPYGQSNYTLGVFGSRRWARIQLDAARPTMRNLECDFSPHLIMDVHPMWPTFLVGGAADIYATNPWWDTYPIPNYPQYDNPTLYNNVGQTFPHNGPWPPNTFTTTAVLSGHINPPGTRSTSFAPSWVPDPTVQFGPFAPCSGNSYSTGAWGFSTCADPLPAVGGFEGHGVRYNCEHPIGSTGSNLQTFLAVIQLEEQQSSATAGPSPSRQAVEESLRREANDLARRRR